MSRTSRCLLLSVLAGLAATLPLLTGHGAAGDSPPQPDSNAAEVMPVPRKVTVAEARRQAEQLHAAMHATLQLVHQRYYREDAGLPIPAAVVEEIFTSIEPDQPARLRWLVVEGQAMNTDHIAATPFEQEAVTALKGGADAFERVEGGIYRRAGPITLTNHCLKCHVPDRKSTEDRTAGLIVAIPVLER
jgi:hypothetical protein